MKQTVILFDINETVLDLSVLRPAFELAFGEEHITDLWFSMLLHSSTVSMLTEVETDFATLARVNLEILAAKQGVFLSADIVDVILGLFSSLPAHSDIQPALEKLRASGFYLVAFSNSSLNLVTKQIGNAGLDSLFDEVISVETLSGFKPSKEVYLKAAEKLKMSPDGLRLVATHDWDTHGALSAGLKAAYINRSGTLYNPLYKKPNIVAVSMMAIADQIIFMDC